MFVDREWLRSQLEAGRSFAEIGRELDIDDSSVAYWAKKHGLRSKHASRFAARGALDRTTLETLAAKGATLREIAAEVDRSVATVRYWLERWGIQRERRASRRPVDPDTAPPVAPMRCKRHGIVDFRLEGRGYYRCTRCRAERVAAWRRRLKLRLVAEAGGCCIACGYSACPAALQFHHLDPSQKSFIVSREGVTRGMAEARAEAKKCVLLCANCHAEVEVGFRELPRQRAA